LTAIFCFSAVTTDNNTSTYGAEMLQQLKETGVESMSARSEYVACEFAIVVYFGNITVVWVFFG
jgi:hypothetical protein